MHGADTTSECPPARIGPRERPPGAAERRDQAAPCTGWSSGVDLLGVQQLPEAGDLQRADHRAGGGEHAQADVLPDGAAVGGGEDAQAGGVEEGDPAEVDGELADVAVVEECLELLAEDRRGGRVDLTGGGARASRTPASETSMVTQVVAGGWVEDAVTECLSGASTGPVGGRGATDRHWRRLTVEPHTDT